MKDPTNPPSSVVTYLDAQVEELRDRLPAAVAGEAPEDVHKARVATRRMKAAFSLLGLILDGKGRKRVNALCKAVRRALGPIRDADVMLGHLAAEFGATEKYRPAVDWFAAHLKDARSTGRAKARKKLDVPKTLEKLGGWYALRQQVIESAEAVPSLLAESLHLQTDAFAEQADWLTGEKPAPDSPDAAAHPPDVHQVRIEGKNLRYTLELAAAEGVSLPKKVFKAFKAMQDELGLWHDYAVLADRAMAESVAAGLSFHAPDTQRAVLDLAGAALRKSQQHLARFERQWKSAGAGLTATIRQGLPLTRPAAAMDDEREDVAS